jgi:hypothetical protein
MKTHLHVRLYVIPSNMRQTIINYLASPKPMPKTTDELFIPLTRVTFPARRNLFDFITRTIYGELWAWKLRSCSLRNFLYEADPGYFNATDSLLTVSVRPVTINGSCPSGNCAAVHDDIFQTGAWYTKCQRV